MLEPNENVINSFNNMQIKNQEILIYWIDNNLIKTKTIQKRHSSYGLKHIFEKSENGFYITNEEFKGAMITCNFNADKNNINWFFNCKVK